MPLPTALINRRDKLKLELRDHLADLESGRVTEGEARTRYQRIDADLTEAEARIAEYTAIDAHERESRAARKNSDNLAHRSSGGGDPDDDRDTRTRRTPFGDVDEWRSLNGRNPAHEVSLDLPTREGRALTAGTATAGAETVQQSVAAEFINSLTARSPVLSMARLIVTEAGGSLDFPRRTSIGTADAEVAEGVAFTEDDPTFDAVTFVSWKYGSLVKASTELLEDAEPDVIAEIAAALGEATARAYEPKLVTGAGTTEPVGYMTGMATGVTAAAAAISTDDLIDLQFSLDSPYWGLGPVWSMNASTMAYIRKLKDADSNYLLSFVPGADSSPFTPRLLGHPVVIVPDMADIGTGNSSVAFGVMDRFYGVRVVGRDRQVAVDSSTDYAFANDQVTWRSRIRLDGQVLDVNAANALTHA